MKEQKNLSYSLRKVAHPFKSSLNSMFLPILSLPGAFVTLTNVNYVKNAIFENYFGITAYLFKKNINKFANKANIYGNLS